MQQPREQSPRHEGGPDGIPRPRPDAQRLGQPARGAGAEGRRARHTLDLAHDIFLRFGPDGRIVEANATAVETYGYERDELLRLSATDLCVPEARSAGAGAWETDAGPTDVGFETLHLRRDGSTFPVEVATESTWINGVLYRESFVRDISARRSASDAQRESEAQYRAITDSASDAIVTIRDDGIITAWNPAATRLFGHDRSAAIGQPVTIIIPGHSVSAHTRGLARFRETSERRIIGHGVEVDGLRRDGTEFPIELSLSEWRTPGGHHATAIIRDITERRRSVAALRASEQRFRTIFDEAPLGVALVDSLSGRFLDVNPRFAQIAGRTRDEVVGLDWMALTHPDDIPPEIENMARFNAGEMPGFGREKRYLRPDGTVVWIGLTIARIRAGGGGRPHHLTMIEDISERKRTEDELRRRNEFVERILENAPIGFAVNTIDDGRPVFVGTRFAEIYGVAPETIGSVDDFFEQVYRDPAVRAEMRARTMADIASGDPARMCWPEIPILTDTGEHRYVDAANIPLPEQNLMISTVQDVTARKRAEQARENLQAQLTRSQKLESVGRLAGGIAHDFNNLLTAIRGFGGLLAATLPADGPQAADLAEMLRAAERATELTHQLLAFSRNSALEPRVIDLPTVLAGISPLLRRLIGEDVELVVRSTSGPGRALADPGQVEQVIVNLAVNARDAMPGGGILTLETGLVDLDESFVSTHAGAVPGHYVLLAVSDTGDGMSPDIADHIFEPFFTTKGPGKGTGLGLSTVFGIVRQSNGYISAYSEPGRGTTFKVYLPRVDEPAEVGGSAPAAAPPPGGSETILLVEDEEAVRRFACRVLERSGYRVVAAGNGSDAVAIARTDPADIDLLFSDIVMPGISGPQAALDVLAARPEIGLLYTSGYTEEAALQLNVIDPDVPLLSKPYSADGLLEHVRAALDRAAARRRR